VDDDGEGVSPELRDTLLQRGEISLGDSALGGASVQVLLPCDNRSQGAAFFSTSLSGTPTLPEGGLICR
jgi:hypothetical protein